MKRGRFSEEQIIAILREHEAGAKAAELARKHGISEATLYNWKAKYGGLDVSEAKRLMTLEEAKEPWWRASEYPYGFPPASQ
jgi:putative transposase